MDFLANPASAYFNNSTSFMSAKFKEKKRIKMYNYIHKRTSTCITEGKDMVVRNLSTAQNNVRNQHQGGKYHILLS